MHVLTLVLGASILPAVVLLIPNLIVSPGSSISGWFVTRCSTPSLQVFELPLAVLVTVQSQSLFPLQFLRESVVANFRMLG